MAVKILDAVSDSSGWHRLLARLPAAWRDIYFKPEYAALHRFQVGARALLFAYERDEDLWLYSFLLQPIQPIGEHLPGQEWFDIETPYGYGGPLASTIDAGFLAEAHEAFTAWCRGANVVAEFARLHPLLQNQRWLDPQMELIYDRETVSLNLTGFDTLSVDELPVDRTARHKLRRAARLGVRVEVCPAEDYFDEFVRLYRLTMERLGADDYYYFNEQYFSGLRRLVSESGWLLAALHEGQWVAAALFLKGQAWLHYHLSASDPALRLPGAKNQLIYTAAQLGSRSGLSTLHLGGGISPAADDSLLIFKRSMGTDAHSFYIGKRIHQPQAYAGLREAWERAYPSLLPRYGHRLLCYRSRI